MDDEQKAQANRLGAEIRRLRVAAGKTQEDLADEARMTTNYVSLVERGETNVTLAAATRITRALGVKLSEVLEKVGEQKVQAHHIRLRSSAAKRSFPCHNKYTDSVRE